MTELPEKGHGSTAEGKTEVNEIGNIGKQSNRISYDKDCIKNDTRNTVVLPWKWENTEKNIKNVGIKNGNRVKLESGSHKSYYFAYRNSLKEKCIEKIKTQPAETEQKIYQNKPFEQNNE